MPKNIVFLVKNIFKSSFIFSKNRGVKYFGFLTLTTIFFHLLAWKIINITQGSIWYYSNRIIKQSELLHPAIDGGYFEHFQYILLIWCASLSFIIFLKQDRWTYPLPIIYSFLFLDDSLSFHDKVFSDTLIPIFDNSFFSRVSLLRIKDFAEISYWIIIFILIILLVIPVFAKGSTRSKEFIFDNFKFFILLAFFASFIDILESNIDNFLLFFKLGFLQNTKLLNLLIITEEVGEILTIALICIWLFNTAINKRLLQKKSKT